MTQAMNPTLALFAQHFAQFQNEHRSRIAQLEAEIGDQLDNVSELLDTYAETLYSRLGAQAANAAGDDKRAQENAIVEVERWVEENISKDALSSRIALILWIQGPEVGAQEIRNELKSPEVVSVRLTLDVTYTPNSVTIAQLVEHLRRACDQAIGDGLLTGDTDAEVLEHSFRVGTLPTSPDEEAVAQFLSEKIINGELSMEDVPVRMAQYGFMEPDAFLEEMHERMQVEEDESQT